MSSEHRPLARVLLLMGLAVLLSACEPHRVSPDEVEGPHTWGGVDSVTRLRHLWFSGQPDRAALERARAEGISVVIDLRDPSERAWDERSEAEALGLTYHNVPVPGDQPFDPVAFRRIEALVEQHHGAGVLVHCSSSNRAGGWLATHLVREHDMPVDEALAIGRRAGITRPAIEQKVREYLTAPGD